MVNWLTDKAPAIPTATAYRAGRFRKWTSYLTVLVLATLGIAVRAWLFPEVSAYAQALIFFLTIAVMVFAWNSFGFINRFLNRHLPYESGITRRIIIQLITNLLFVYSFRWLLIALFRNQIPVEITRLMTLIILMVDGLLTMAINGWFIGRHFFEEWKKALLRTERLQKERSVVQFENLKNQLNPHFLFNSLTSLNSLIFENQPLASQFLQQLSKVYRYLLQNKEKELVSLETEMQFIENYIFLLKTRFSGSLDIVLDIDELSRTRQIVPVTLQILIENAIKHNVVNEASPLTVQIFTRDNFLYVRNNLQRKKIIEHSNKVGLENMQLLYSYLSPEPVAILEDEHSFTVKIPLLENKSVVHENSYY
jgi:two-component system, LytTR family, sensor kinase